MYEMSVYLNVGHILWDSGFNLVKAEMYLS